MYMTMRPKPPSLRDGEDRSSPARPGAVRRKVFQPASVRDGTPHMSTSPSAASGSARPDLAQKFETAEATVYSSCPSHRVKNGAEPGDRRASLDVSGSSEIAGTGDSASCDVEISESTTRLGQRSKATMKAVGTAASDAPWSLSSSSTTSRIDVRRVIAGGSSPCALAGGKILTAMILSRSTPLRRSSAIRPRLSWFAMTYCRVLVRLVRTCGLSARIPIWRCRAGRVFGCHLDP